jgi:hypothetical protein
MWTNNFFLWTVSPDLPDANDYALQIFEMANVNNINRSARFSLTGGMTAPTATTNQASGTGVGTGSSMGIGSALPRNTTIVLVTLKSLTATCSGPNGIWVGPGTPSATGQVTSTASSTLLPAATSMATGDAGKLVSCPEHALILAGGLALATP